MSGFALRLFGREVLALRLDRPAPATPAPAVEPIPPAPGATPHFGFSQHRMGVRV